MWGISLPENDRERQARRKIDHTDRNDTGLPYADGKLKSTQIALLATAAWPPDLLWLSKKKKSTQAIIVFTNRIRVNRTVTVKEKGKILR